MHSYIRELNIKGIKGIQECINWMKNGMFLDVILSFKKLADLQLVQCW